MKIKSFAMAALVLGVGAVWGASSTPEGWIDDYDAALKRAAAEKRPVLVNFTGSDWCGWCKRLSREVFATDVFRKAAAEKYVLLFIDSPRDKSLLSDHAREQNPQLGERYGIRGYPTVVLLDAQGKKLAQTGYQAGGPEKYLKHLESLISEAPLVEQYIKPIEAVLNHDDDEFEREMRSVFEDVRRQLPEPPMMATEAARREWKEKFMEMARVKAKAVFQKYASRYEAAFAKARAMKVPPELEARKAELIDAQEKNFRAMQKELGAGK